MTQQEQLLDIQARHRQASEVAIRNAAHLVNHLAAAGPLWQATLDALHEVNTLGRTMIRQAAGPVGVHRVFGSGKDGHGALACAVRDALASTGIGTTGPHIEGVQISPTTMAVTSATDLERRLREAFAYQRQAIGHTEQEEQ